MPTALLNKQITMAICMAVNGNWTHAQYYFNVGFRHISKNHVENNLNYKSLL